MSPYRMLILYNRREEGVQGEERREEERRGSERSERRVKGEKWRGGINVFYHVFYKQHIQFHLTVIRTTLSFSHLTSVMRESIDSCLLSISLLMKK